MPDNSGLIVDALLKTDAALYRSVDAANSWKAAIRKRGARVALYRDYERGDHRAVITKQMRKLLRLNSDDAEITDFNDNYCRIVIDKMAGRLFISNISIDEPAQEWLAQTLLRNDFDAQQSEWFRGAIRDGDAYVMVDPKTFTWTSEPAYDGFSGIVVIYDDATRKPTWACKLWSEADTQDVAKVNDTTGVTIKMVVYQPKQVSYWYGAEGGNEVKPDKEAPWPLASKNLPLVHLANQADNYTAFGESELRPAIPLQDILNRTLHSMVMASEYTAYKIKWSIGMKISQDGIIPGAVINLVPIDPSKGITAEQVGFINAIKVGEFGETDISQYTNQIDQIVRQISQATQTPIYGITADGNLSGEALKQLEIGLIGKIERFQRQNVDAVKELITLTAEMQNTFEGENAPVFTDVNIIWKSPELLDVNARIATLVQLREKTPGLFPDDWYIKRIGVLLGMGQKDIEEVVEKAQAQRGFDFDRLAIGVGEVTA